MPKGLSWSHGWGSQVPDGNPERQAIVASHDGDIDPRLSPRASGFRGAVGAPAGLVSASPQGAEWTASLVPSNFLEGPMGLRQRRLRQEPGGRSHPETRSVKTWAPGLAVGSLCYVVGGSAACSGQGTSAQGGCAMARTQPGGSPASPSSMCPSAWWGEA